MLTRRITLLVVTLALGSVLAGGSVAGDASQIPSSRPRTFTDDAATRPQFMPEFLRLTRPALPAAVGPAGQVGTVLLPGFQSENSMAAAGSQVVVGYNDSRGAFGLGIMYSADGGATFSDGGQLFQPAGFFSEGDPAVAVYRPPVGPAVFYCATLGQLPTTEDAIVIYRSVDGGVSWAGPFTVTSSVVAGDFPDRESMTVDPETGRVLIAWTHFPAAGAITMRATYSDDAATGLPPTWSAAAIVGARPQDGQATTIVANPTNNTVYLAWQTFWSTATGNRGIALAKSADNGATWTSLSDIGPLFWRHLCPYGFDRWLWSFSGSTLAYNPADGGLEMVYTASVDGTPGLDFGDIYYRRSTDDGGTWSPAAPLNVFPGADRPQAQPCVSVTKGGRIDVYWYDESAGSGLDDLTDAFYTFSSNLGGSWSSPVPVEPTPFHNESGNNFGAPHQGDYNDAYSDALTAGPGYGAFAVMAEPSATTTGPDGYVFTAAGVQVAPLRVRPGTVVVADHGCGANDGILVANESADLTIPLENIGRGSLTGITATLSAITPGVAIEPGTRSYGTLASGASGVSTDVYRIGLGALYPCGTPCKLRLTISAIGVASTFVEFSIPTGVVASVTTLLSENFDTVIPPALPVGWGATTLAGVPPTPWRTTPVLPASPPNAAFVPQPVDVNFERLFAPNLAVPAGTDYVEVSFDTQYDLAEVDSRFGADGLTFDYQLDGAGGSHFSSGDAFEYINRYTHNIYRGSGGGSGDRSGWSGSSPYKTVVFRIRGLAGHSMRPRFHLTSYPIYLAAGAWVDNVKVSAIKLGCGGCDPTATMVARFDARATENGVELVWSSSATGQVAAWNLYRALSLDGAFARVNSEPIPMGGGGEFRLRDNPGVGGRVYYRLAAIDPSGSEFTLQTIPYDVSASTRSFGFELAGANPFRGQTTLRYSLAERSPVRIEVFNIAGQRVRTLVNGTVEPGTYSVALESATGGAGALRPGVYMVRIVAGRNTRTVRVVALD